MSGDFEISGVLYERAISWPVYWDATERPVRAVRTGVIAPAKRSVPILRCRDCDEEIFGGEGPSALEPTVRHLLTSHGYRMDGRQFDNRNNEVGHA